MDIFGNTPSGRDDRLLVHPVRSWLEFQEAGRDLIDSGEFSYVVRSDIAGFFVHVGHHELADLMEHWGLCTPMKGFVEIMLGRWSGGLGVSREIPQQMDASSLLANALLTQVDRQVYRYGRRVLRYMDDYFIFVKDLADARSALNRLSQALSDLHLTPSTDKTTIVPVAEARDEFDSEVSAGILDLREQQGIPLTRIQAEFDENIGGDFNERKFRKQINQFRRARSDHGVSAVLAKLPEMPWNADLFGSYLQHFANRPDVHDGVHAFLASPEGGEWPWVRHHLLRSFSRVPSTAQTQTLVAQVALDDREHWLARSAGLQVIEHQTTDPLRLQVADLYDLSLPLPLRKAILMTASRLPAQKKNRIFGRWEGQDPRLDRTIGWLRARR